MADPEFTPGELETEEWRDVVGYEGVYSVSDLGRVRRDAPRWNKGYGRCSGGICRPGRILRPSLVKGYWALGLYWEGKSRQRKVHILVAEAFHGPRPLGYEVNHIDTIKTNARASNLEYLTSKKNKEHAKRHGLIPCGEQSSRRRHPESWTIENNPSHLYPEIRRGVRNGRAKLNEYDVREIRALLQAGVSMAEIARRKHVDHSTITGIRNRRLWSHVA